MYLGAFLELGFLVCEMKIVIKLQPLRLSRVLHVTMQVRGLAQPGSQKNLKHGAMIRTHVWYVAGRVGELL